MKPIKIILLLVVFLTTTLLLFGRNTLFNPEKNNSVQIDETNTPIKESASNVLENWAVPISKIITLLSVSIGIFISFGQYRIKVKEEIRLNKKIEAENDVKLLKLFTETFDIANCRKDHIISDIIIEKIFDKDILNKEDFNDLANVNKKLDIATRIIPVGLASQFAAIGAIGYLGTKYEVLREPALQGLKELKKEEIGIEVTEGYIKKITALISGES